MIGLEKFFKEAKMYITNPLMFDRRIGFVTNNRVPNEGFGYQYLHIINCMLFSEIIDRPFHYTPFQSMAHNYNNDPNFLIKKEKLINIIDHFPLNLDIAMQKKQCIGISNAFFEGSTTQLTIKKLFYLEKNKEYYFHSDGTHIAIHIRRLNSQDSQLYRPFNEDMFFYRKLLEFLRSRWTSNKTCYHIYSQGTLADFQLLQSEDVFIHLNEDVEETFCGMVFADVLITAYSCLSYAAGCLSNGIVYYVPESTTINVINSFPGYSEFFPFPGLCPLPSWHPINGRPTYTIVQSEK